MDCDCKRRDAGRRICKSCSGKSGDWVYHRSGQRTGVSLQARNLPELYCGRFWQRIRWNFGVLWERNKSADPQVQSGQRCLRYRNRTALVSGFGKKEHPDPGSDRKSDRSYMGKCTMFKNRTGCRSRCADSGQSQSDPAFEPGNHTFKERCIRTVLFGVSTGRECGEI